MLDLKGRISGQGFKGSVVAIDRKPFYHSTCMALECPEGSSGLSLPSGCRCKPGEQGKVEASVSEPCLDIKSNEKSIGMSYLVAISSCLAAISNDFRPLEAI